MRRTLLLKFIDRARFFSSTNNRITPTRNWNEYYKRYTNISFSKFTTSTNNGPVAASTETVSQSETSSETATVSITFIESDGKEKVIPAVMGKHLLDVAHDNNVDLEGACGGELSCSTCHLIFESDIYNKLPPKLDEEQDMLDLAFGVTETYV